MHKYKKVLTGLVFIALLAQSLALPSTALAQAPKWWAPTHREFNEKVNSAPEGEIFGERYTHAQVWWIVYSLINLAFGTSTMECAAEGSNAAANSSAAAGGAAYADCLVQNGVVPPPGFQSDASLNPKRRPGDWGVLALAAMSDQMISTKPASGSLYVASIAQKILGVPEANAQEGGFGFDALQPLQRVWAAARNAAYALTTLAVVVLAFMIMFRTRISPQAAVTVTSAIPRLIIGLLLIAFSFAIAGFVIDLAYVIQGIISYLISQTSGLVTTGQAGLGASDFLNRVNDVATGIVSFGLVTIGTVLVIGTGPVLALSGFTGGLSIVVGMIVIIVILIIFIIALVKVFWLLLRSYVMIMFHIIALPFAALGYIASPSSNLFMSLLRSLIGHVSIFVTISLLVMFAHLVFWNMAGGPIAEAFSSGVPGEILNPYGSTVGGLAGEPSNLGLPAFGGVGSTQIAIFVGLVILLMSTGVASAIRDWITTGRFMLRSDYGFYQTGALGGLAYGSYKIGKGEYPIPGTKITTGPTVTIAGRQFGMPGMPSGAITGGQKLIGEITKRIR